MKIEGDQQEALGLVLNKGQLLLLSSSNYNWQRGTELLSFPRSKVLSVGIFLLEILLPTNADKGNQEALTFSKIEKTFFKDNKNVEHLLYITQQKYPSVRV